MMTQDVLHIEPPVGPASQSSPGWTRPLPQTIGMFWHSPMKCRPDGVWMVAPPEARVLVKAASCRTARPAEEYRCT